MIEKRKLICISCPVGCELTVILDEEKIIEVMDNACKLGIEFAEQEIFNPQRMVASTVKVINGYHPLVPVYTEKPIPKPMISDILKEIRKVEVEAPIKHNAIVIENVLGTGVNIIASRDLPEA